MPQNDKVMIGLPNQGTTGAIYDAPVGTAAPETASAALGSAFTASGYVTEDGLSLSTDISTNDIKDWSGSTVRKVLESFDGTISWAEMEMSYESMCHAFGSTNVTKEDANATHGTQIKVGIGAQLPAPRAWVFNMKDGDARMRIYVPEGQVTSLDEITFNASDPISFPITLSCYPDSDGKAIYIMTDDGKVVSA